LSTATFLQRFPPSPRDGLPKYARLRAALVAAIEAGHWKPGEKLPTELELASVTPFSLGTVQRALRALVDEGVISRVQGSGTYVSSGEKKIEDTWHLRFLDDGETGVLPLFSKALSRRRVKGAGPWSRHFPGQDRRVSRIDRILSVNGEFNVYGRFFFDSTRLKSLLTMPLSRLSGTNFKKLLREEFSVPVTDISQQILFSRLPDDVNRVIGTATGTHGGILDAVARSASGEVVYFQQFFIPPSSRKLVPMNSRGA